MYGHFKTPINQNGTLLIKLFYKLGLKMFNASKGFLRRSRVYMRPLEVIFCFASKKETTEKINRQRAR